MKIKICLPYYDRIHEECLDSIKELRKHFDLDVSGVLHTSFLLNGRNSTYNSGKSDDIYQKFNDIHFFLSMDQDIHVLPEQLQKLIESDEDIVSALYQTHGNPSIFQCGYLNESGTIKSKIGYSDKNQGLREVDFVGCGCLLIKPHVLEKTEYPWFRTELIREGDKQKYCGEDIGFCRYMKRNGFKIHVNTDVQVKHIFRNPKKYELF